MRRVGIVAKPDAAEAGAVLATLVEWLTARGIEVLLEKETAALLDSPSPPAVDRAELPGMADLLVVLGGDGTLLATARTVRGLGIPLLGVNLGGLGFLTATTRDEAVAALAAAVAGDMAIDERTMLAASVVRGGERVFHDVALNDAVIMKAAMSRIINLQVAIEGRYATAYRADGLIISTPTGSTAYCLSAGGPILSPAMDAIVLTPICSHTLTNRPIVLPGSHAVDVTLESRQQVMLSLDGQVGFGLEDRDTVEVRQAPARIRLMRFPQRDFHSVLRTKLKWGER